MLSHKSAGEGAGIQLCVNVRPLKLHFDEQVCARPSCVDTCLNEITGHVCVGSVCRVCVCACVCVCVRACVCLKSSTNNYCWVRFSDVRCIRE
jgi:hypothetical protein